MADTHPATSETEQQLALWQAALSRGEEICVATIVRVDGSSYRRVGAKMLVMAGGERAGMVSGGCLEAEIARKIWWLTERGAHVDRYETSFDDENHPSNGLGCGGTLDILLERGESARQVMNALCTSVEQRRPAVVVSVIESTDPEIALGTRAVWISAENGDRVLRIPNEDESLGALVDDNIRRIGSSAFASKACSLESIESHAGKFVLFADYLAPPPALLVLGAGEDAKPVVALARMMGWHVAVGDARSHLATRDRFPDANLVITLPKENLSLALPAEHFDAVVMMTHSYAQDRALLGTLLPHPPPYLGILGPRRRTRQLVAEAAAALGLDADSCMARLRSPVGLDLGAKTPETIALAIIAEVQEAIASRSTGEREAPKSELAPTDENSHIRGDAEDGSNGRSSKAAVRG